CIETKNHSFSINAHFSKMETRLEPRPFLEKGHGTLHYHRNHRSRYSSHVLLLLHVKTSKPSNSAEFGGFLSSPNHKPP
ncbi:hypothetical protein N9A86_04700, partial [Akkermansiaceae bacterium]|nr:hypothetical protein [Akkermansiaceae bacterium]